MAERQFKDTTRLNLNSDSDTMSLYRAVGYAELSSIMKTKKFSLRKNGLESNYFGKDFSETLLFANMVFNIHVVAIIEATIAKGVLDRIGDFTKVDFSVFRSGTIEVHKENIEELNNAILEIKHIF